MFLVKIPIEFLLRNDGKERCRPAVVPSDGITRGRFEMSDELDHLANLLGRAAMHVWGDIPRDVQEALFETAMKGRTAERESLARVLHDRHPKTQHPARPG
jgi:hypothetical protein